MMEFIAVYGFIAMLLVVIVGNLTIVENYNKQVITNDTETGFILVDDTDVNLMGVDFGKFKQR